MSTTKRVISVLVCLAMLFSTTASLAYALGDLSITAENTAKTDSLAQTGGGNTVAAQEESSALDTEQLQSGAFASDLKGSSAGAYFGANPKADYLDLVDLGSNEVYVVDADMTETNGQTYTLTWDDTPGTAPRTHDYIVGQRAFTSPRDAFDAAKNNGVSCPIILIKSLPFTKTETGIYDCRILDILRGDYTAKYYTEAYRTLPYVVSNTPGEAWTVNPDYEARTIKIFQINPYKKDFAYDLTIAGFSVVSYPTSDVYTNEYNSGRIDLHDVQGSYKQNFTLVNTYLSAEHKISDNASLKMATAADNNAGGTLTIANIYFHQTSAVPRFTINTDTVPYSSFVMDGWYFDTANGTGTFMDNVSDFQDINLRGTNVSFVLRNSYLLNMKSRIRPLSSINGGGLLTSSQTHSYIVENNTFYNSSLSNYTGRPHGALHVPDRSWNRLTISSNHVEYTDAAPYWSDGYGLLGSDYSSPYGGDAGQQATVTNNRLVGIARDFKVAMPSGDYNDTNTYWTVNLSENYYTSGTDKTARGVSYNASAHNTTADNYYLDYAMMVLNTDAATAAGGFFSESYSGSDFTKQAVYLDPSVSSAGRNVDVTVEGTAYTFIKGRNAFSNIDDIFALFGNNSNPQIILGSYSSSESIDIPYAACIYGKDYETSPHTAAWDVNGSWTGGSQVKNINVLATAQGAIEIYGVELSGTVIDNRRPEGRALDIVIENVKFSGNRTGNDKLIANLENNNTKSQNCDDSFIARNVYICVSGTTQKLFANYFPKDVTFDNLWLDGTGLTPNYTDIYQVAPDSSFTITNSKLANLSKDEANGVLRFQAGGPTSYNAATNKTLAFTNNEISDFVTARDSSIDVGNGWGIFDIATAGYSAITITGNTVSVSNKSANTNLIFTTAHNANITNNRTVSLEVKNNILNGINPDMKLWYNGNPDTLVADVEFDVSGNYVTATYAATPTAAGVPLTANAHPIDADDTFGAYRLNSAGSSTSDIYGVLMDTSGNILNWNEYTFENVATREVKLSDYILAKYDSEQWRLEGETNVEKIYVGSISYEAVLQFVSKTGAVGGRTLTVTFERANDISIFNEIHPDKKENPYSPETYAWLSWRGIVELTGDKIYEAQDNQITNIYSIGTIFLAGTSELSSFKADLETGVENCNTRADIENLISTVNNKGYTKSKAYIMPAGKYLFFDDTAQAYTYRYNFLVKRGNTRATVMYVIYEEEGVYKIKFSNGVMQKAQ